MLSPVWQRMGMIAGILLGSLCWLGILPSLQSVSGTGGLVLLDTHSVWQSVVLVAIAGIPAMALGTLLSTVGRFTAGVTILAGSLLVLSWYGGPTMGWMQRAALPGAYWGLIFETLIWQLLMLCAIGLMYRFRPVVHGTLPHLLRHDQPQWQTKLGIPASREIIAAVISAAISGIMAYLLIRNGSPKQVLVSLVVSFALGAGVGQSTIPNSNPIAIFISPGIVAIIAYLMVIMRFGNDTAVFQVLFGSSVPGTKLMAQFPGPALALPIHYLSAGLLGCCFGIGIASATAMPTEEDTLAEGTN